MLRRFLAAGSIIGAVVPAALWARHLVTQELFGALEVLLWPPSILLMALEGSPGAAWTWAVVAASVLLNMLWYVVLAFVIYLGYSLTSRLLADPRAEP